MKTKEETKTTGADLVITFCNISIYNMQIQVKNVLRSLNSLLFTISWNFTSICDALHWLTERRFVMFGKLRLTNEDAKAEVSAFAIIHSISRELMIILDMKLRHDWSKSALNILRDHRTLRKHVCVVVEGRIISLMSTSNLDMCVSWCKVTYTPLWQERGERAVIHEEYRVQLDKDEKCHTIQEGRVRLMWRTRTTQWRRWGKQHQYSIRVMQTDTRKLMVLSHSVLDDFVSKDWWNFWKRSSVTLCYQTSKELARAWWLVFTCRQQKFDKYKTSSIT